MNADERQSVPSEPTPTELGLFDKSHDILFDDLTDLAKEICSTPVALISIIDYDGDRQVFASQKGLSSPFSESCQTPLSHSFCRHVLELDVPLMVGNSKIHPLVKCNPAIDDLDVVAYIGVPVYGPDNAPIGAICAIDHKIRKWSNTHIRKLEALARCVSNRIALRAEVIRGKRRNAELESRNAQIARYNAVREAITVAIASADLPVEERFRAILKSGCDAFGMERAAIAKYQTNQASIVFAYGSDVAELEGSRQKLSGALSGLIMRDRVALTFHDLNHAPCDRRVDFAGHRPKSYLSAPLILGSITYGLIEFSSDTPREESWSEEDLSILSLISILTASHLTLVDESDRLRNSEMALVRYIGEIRDRERAANSDTLTGIEQAN